MRKAIHGAQIVLFFGLLAVPELSRRLHWVRERELEGAVVEAKLPVLNARDIWNGSLQERFDSWYNAHVGLRSYAIVADNTLTFRLFGEAAALSRVIVGENGTLFIDDDIDFFNLTETRPFSDLDLAAMRLRRLSDAMVARHAAAVTIVAPAKTLVFPTEVSHRWTRTLPSPRPAAIEAEQIRRVLVDHRVPFVDGRRIIQDVIREHNREFYYGRHGRHWTYLSACLTLREAIDRMRGHLPGEVPPVDCSGAFLGLSRRDNVDNDLHRLLNLWTPFDEFLPAQLWRNDAAAAGGHTLGKLRALFVGTSFTGQLVREADRQRLFSQIHWDYYNQTIITLPNSSVPMPKPGTPEWKAFVFAHDVFIIESPEIWFTNPGGGFPGEVLEALGERAAIVEHR